MQFNRRMFHAEIQYFSGDLAIITSHLLCHSISATKIIQHSLKFRSNFAYESQNQISLSQNEHVINSYLWIGSTLQSQFGQAAANPKFCILAVQEKSHRLQQYTKLLWLLSTLSILIFCWFRHKQWFSLVKVLLLV